MSSVHHSNSALWRVLSALLLCLLLSLVSNGQSKVDLEVKVQTGSDTAQGGETFSYSAVITNIGPNTATNVVLRDEPDNLVELQSVYSEKGKCELEKEAYKTFAVCDMDNLAPNATATVFFQCRLRDFGDISRPGAPGSSGYGNGNGDSNSRAAASAALNKLAEAMSRDQKDGIKGYDTDPQGSLGNLWLSSGEADENETNNRAEIRVKLLPSKNIPPRVEVLSPKTNAVLLRPVKDKTGIPFTIKAFDLDGSIQRVTVYLNFSPSTVFLEDDGKFTYLIEGRKYSQDEFYKLSMEKWQELVEQEKAGTVANNFLANSLYEKDAVKNGKDSFEYVAKEFGYGPITGQACAYDNGGRVECTEIRFRVKGNGEVKFLDPKVQVIRPNSTIALETTAKVLPDTNAKVLLYGLDGQTSYSDDAPLMTQAARNATSVNHRYEWQPTKQGLYWLRARLYENGVFTDSEDSIRVFVAEPRVIKITSIRDGQECTLADECRIEVFARDANNEKISDELEILLDGKPLFNIYSSDCGECAPKSATFFRPYTEKGPHTVQIVAKQNDIELGRSQLYTVILK